MKRWLLCALLLALLTLLLSACGGGDPPALTAAPGTPVPTSVPTSAVTVPAEETAVPTQSSDSAAIPAPTPTAEPARAYVLVSWASGQGWLPLAPEGEEYSFPLQQADTQGHLLENVIHVTDSGVYMESATCENQDCVKQGYVTVENRETRVLSNMIICLPQQVTLQLFTPEEIMAMYPQ